MIELDDYDKTLIPETLAECKQLADREAANSDYDLGQRSPALAARHRWLGKMTEGKIAMHLHKVGIGLKHAVRVGKCFADSGADLQLDAAHGNICMQVKSTQSKHRKLYFTDGKYQTAAERLQKLCDFVGVIVVVHEDADGKRRCWLGNGKIVAMNYTESTDYPGYELKFEECF